MTERPKPGHEKPKPDQRIARRNLELRSAGPRETLHVGTGIGAPAVAGRRAFVPRTITPDPARLLRFIARRLEILDWGVRATSRDGLARNVRWVEIGAILIRRLPADPPWKSAVLLDLVPVVSSGGSSTPVRLLSESFVNYSALPCGAATSPLRNMQCLGQFLVAHNPLATVDAETDAFLQEAGPCPTFSRLSAFLQYDAEYPDSDP